MLNGITTRSPGLICGDLRADLLDDAHRLVAEDVALVHKRAEHLVQMQVRPQIPVDVIRRSRPSAPRSSGRARCRRGRPAFRGRRLPSCAPPFDCGRSSATRDTAHDTSAPHRSAPCFAPRRPGGAPPARPRRGRSLLLSCVGGERCAYGKLGRVAGGQRGLRRSARERTWTVRCSSRSPAEGVGRVNVIFVVGR